MLEAARLKLRTGGVLVLETINVSCWLAFFESYPEVGIVFGGTLPAEEPVRILRFANRVPLQFDKSACAMTQAAESVNWRAYGLNQPKSSLPLGPYIIAVSVVSPFIKFKNASKETVDASDELVEEIRRTLIQAGQRLTIMMPRTVATN